jgi:hypothetical protein
MHANDVETIKFVDIAGRWEFPIPGMAGYVHFSFVH